MCNYFVAICSTFTPLDIVNVHFDCAGSLNLGVLFAFRLRRLAESGCPVRDPFGPTRPDGGRRSDPSGGARRVSENGMEGSWRAACVALVKLEGRGPDKGRNQGHMRKSSHPKSARSNRTRSFFFCRLTIGKSVRCVRDSKQPLPALFILIWSQFFGPSSAKICLGDTPLRTCH